MKYVSVPFDINLFFDIINENKKCRMKCDDGILLMPSMTIEFEGEIYE